MAQRLTGVLRPGDSLARLAGDEFVILCEDLDDAVRRGRHRDAARRRPGATVRPRRGCEVHDRRQHRDRLHRPRRRGAGGAHPRRRSGDVPVQARPRSSITRSSTCASCTSPRTRPSLARGLPGADERGELHLEYQPIVTTARRPAHRRRGPSALDASGSRAGAAHGVHPASPSRSGQIIELGRWVLDRAWSDRQRLAASSGRRAIGDVGQRLAAPVHVRRLRRHRRDVLDAAETDPGLLTLELTENVFVRTPAAPWSCSTSSRPSA